MLQRRHPPRVVAVGLLVAGLSLPTAALADTIGHADPANDAQQITETAAGTTITPAPHNKTADIVHLRASYGTRRFKETVRLRGTGRHWFLRSRIISANRHFDLVLQHDPGSNQVSLTRGKGQMPVVCDGLVPEIDRRRHAASVTMPADCLFTPSWVRLGTGIVTRGQARGVSFADDALRLRGIAETNLTLSPQIHHG